MYLPLGPQSLFFPSTEDGYKADLRNVIYMCVLYFYASALSVVWVDDDILFTFRNWTNSSSSSSSTLPD
jgi:hypothetical protein